MSPTDTPAVQSPPDKPSTTTDTPAIHRERKRDIAAYLVCSGFQCTGFDGVNYTFEDPLGEVCFEAAGYKNGATVEPRPFLRALHDLSQMTERWEREHQSPEDRGGFFQLKHSFWRDPNLSKNAKLVGTSLASHANIFGISFPGMDVIEAECGIKKGRITLARQELIDAGYLKKHARHNPDGTFNGWEYEVTSKMVHPRRKK